MIPDNIIINVGCISHTNAESNGFAFGIIAEYGLVSSNLTILPTVFEFTGL